MYFVYVFYFWFVFVTARRLSLIAVCRTTFHLRCEGFWLQWLLLLSSMGFRAQAQQSWHMGFVALRPVDSSQARDQTYVPCIGRQIPIHCSTRGGEYVFV